jgi:hypothetical protein
MRRLVSACLLVVCGLGVACAGPHSSGALWAQQNSEQEHALFQFTDAQRASMARAFELTVADTSLRTEQARITAELQNCPAPRQPLGVSPGDSVRDAIRVQSQGDSARLAAVAQLALADWYARRASALGNAQWCDRGRAARSGTRSATAADTSTHPGAEVPAADLLSTIPAAIVSRDPTLPRDAAPPLAADPPLVTLSAYALGALDSVYAGAPLPQYLAVVYGGFVSSQPVLHDEAAAALVDAQAPAYPDWEPDALYAALRGAQS